MDNSSKFLLDSENIAFDLQHRNTIRFNISKYDSAVKNGLERYSNIELAKQKASVIKDKVQSNWADFLLEFEQNISNRGTKVIWSRTGNELLEKLIDILISKGVKVLVKSKSMTTEEIELNDYLETRNIESVETDLGEFIVQVAGEKPYHIVTPAMHKSKEDVAELFNEKFNTPLSYSPEELTSYVRSVLRKIFVSADVGITGANFLVADIGAVALTENEGNGLMSTSFPKIHIVIAGIEKIIPSVNDLSLLWPLLAVHGTGQNMTVYNTLFTGPKKENEIDGPEEMYVFLLDNGRTDLFEKDNQYTSLKCIRCGACLNVCPVYKNIGGYTYNSTYSGPIGSVITPHFGGFKDFKQLSFASSLCGKCTEVCPVKIDLHNLLLYNRREAISKGFSPPVEKVGMKVYEFAMKNPLIYNMGSASMKNKLVSIVSPNIFGKKRSFPEFKPSFKKQWKKRK